MKKYSLIIVLLLTSMISQASLIEFQPKGDIKANDLNTNFNYIKGLLSSKGHNVNFSSFSSGQIIDKNQLNSEFDKIRNLGINIPTVTGDIISSSLFNSIFNYTKASISEDELSLLLHFNSSPIIDNSPYNRTVSLHETSFISPNSKFGDGALAFDNPDGNSFAKVDYSKEELLGDDDFTIEAFFFPTDSGSNWGDKILSAGTGFDASPGFVIQMVGGSPKLLIADGSGTYLSGWKYLNVGSINVGLNSWHHVALVKNGNDLLYFVDGQLSFSGNFTDTNIEFTSLIIGSYESVNLQGFHGRIDEVRISKKAQYTQAFSPTSSEFLTSSNNVILWDENPAYASLDNGGLTTTENRGSSTYLTILASE